MPSAAEFAQAVRDERMEFDDALEEYLGQHYPDKLDISFFWLAVLAVSYANMGQPEKILPVSDEEKLTVKQIIERFGLGPFLEATNGEGETQEP